MKKIFQGNKGFTLIEIIVAMGIFTMVSLVAVTIAIDALRAQRKIFALQIVQENSRYLIESMSKEIRMSKINSPDGLSDSLNVTNSKGEAINYNFSDSQLLRGAEILNSNQIKATGNFYVQKIGQPKVTIAMTVENKAIKPEQRAKINLETTISSRAY